MSWRFEPDEYGNPPWKQPHGHLRTLLQQAKTDGEAEQLKEAFFARRKWAWDLAHAPNDAPTLMAPLTMGSPNDAATSLDFSYRVAELQDLLREACSVDKKIPLEVADAVATQLLPVIRSRTDPGVFGPPIACLLRTVAQHCTKRESKTLLLEVIAGPNKSWREGVLGSIYLNKLLRGDVEISAALEKLFSDEEIENRQLLDALLIINPSRGLKYVVRLLQSTNKLQMFAIYAKVVFMEGGSEDIDLLLKRIQDLPGEAWQDRFSPLRGVTIGNILKHIAMSEGENLGPALFAFEKYNFGHLEGREALLKKLGSPNPTSRVKIHEALKRLFESGLCADSKMLKRLEAIVSLEADPSAREAGLTALKTLRSHLRPSNPAS